ncbi:hypothetical protein RUND412_007123 [Rhizina undulata]
MTLETELTKRRSKIFTWAVVGVVAAGAYMGAILKTEQQQRTEVEKRKSEGFDSKIERLEMRKSQLERSRLELEAKIKQSEERRKQSAAEE